MMAEDVALVCCGDDNHTTGVQKVEVFSVTKRGDGLQAKAAVVEELEEHLMEAAEQRASAAAQRSAADEAAELEPAAAAVSAALGVLSRGGELAGDTFAPLDLASVKAWTRFWRIWVLCLSTCTTLSAGLFSLSHHSATGTCLQRLIEELRSSVHQKRCCDSGC